jgi:hypothetical protein
MESRPKVLDKVINGVIYSRIVRIQTRSYVKLIVYARSSIGDLIPIYTANVVGSGKWGPYAMAGRIARNVIAKHYEY